jgi:membrane associated rhomboid family serine protease
MFPVGDQDLVEERFSFVTYALLAINILVFVLLEVPRMGNASAINNFIQTYGAVPADLQQGQALITVLTSMFLHGGWMHLIGNMLFLWVFGDNIETVMGHIPYFIFYMLGGFAATLAHVMTNLGSTIPAVGASGAISAVLGAYLLMFPGNKVKMLIMGGRRGTGMTYVNALVFLGVWGVTQFVNGFGAIANTAETDGVAYWAHIGGFVFGLVAGLLFRGRASRMAVHPAR